MKASYVQIIQSWHLVAKAKYWQSMTLVFILITSLFVPAGYCKTERPCYALHLCNHTSTNMTPSRDITYTINLYHLLLFEKKIFFVWFAHILRSFTLDCSLMTYDNTDHRLLPHAYFFSRDSSVGIVTRLQAGRSGVRIPTGAWEFSSKRPDGLWDPPSLIFNVYWGSSPGVKRPGREADHSSPKNDRTIPQLPLYAFMCEQGLLIVLFCCKHSRNTRSSPGVRLRFLSIRQHALTKL